MRLPAIFRTTPFRLTLLFLALFAAAAAAFLAYIYIATAGEVTRKADREVTREMTSLQGVYRQGGMNALNAAMVERAAGDRTFFYLLLDKDGRRISGTIEESPVRNFKGGEQWVGFQVTETDMDGAEVKRPARGLQQKLAGGESLFIGADVGAQEAYVTKIVRALWGAGALVIVASSAGR